MNEKLSPEHSGSFQNSKRVDFSKYRDSPQSIDESNFLETPSTGETPSTPSPETSPLPPDFDTNTLLIDNSPLKTEIEIANNPGFREKYQQLLDQLKGKLKPIVATVLLAAAINGGLTYYQPSPLETSTSSPTINQEILNLSNDAEWEQQQAEWAKQDEVTRQEMNNYRQHGEYRMIALSSSSYSHVDETMKVYEDFLNNNQLNILSNNWDRKNDDVNMSDFLQLTADFSEQVCKPLLAHLDAQDRWLIESLILNASHNTNQEGLRDMLDVREANLLAILDLEKAVPGGVRLLHEQCGIENFYRYRPDDLVRQCQLLQTADNQANTSAGDQLKGYVLYVSAHADHNLVFDTSSEKENYSQIDTLGDGYANIFLEASRVTQLAHLVKNTSSTLGKSDVMVIRGHGSPAGIALGRPAENGDMWNRRINILELLRAGKVMEQAVKGDIILDSCSAGTSELQLDDSPVTSDNSFGADLSVHTPGHNIYAAEKDSNFLHNKYRLGENGQVFAQPLITRLIEVNNQTEEVDITNHYFDGILQELVSGDQVISGDHYPQHAFHPEQMGADAHEVFEITSLLSQAHPENLPLIQPERISALSFEQQNEIVRFFIEDGSVQNPQSAIEVMSQILPNLDDTDPTLMTALLQDYLKFNLGDLNYFTNLDLIAAKILPEKQANYQKFKQAATEAMTSNQVYTDEQIKAIFESLPAGYWEPLVLYLQNSHQPQADTFWLIHYGLGKG